MENNQHDEIRKLDQRLTELIRKQRDYIEEINQLRRELYALKTGSQEIISESAAAPVQRTSKERKPVYESPVHETPEVQKMRVRKDRSELERFIGENLINKIGIVIVILGVSVGAKYAIDHNLISPATRIVLGYGAAGLLGFFSTILFRNYRSFSAVLLSGAFAIAFFITYAAFTYYGFFGKLPTFLIMFLLTAGTSVSALRYNNEIIAQFGLVGAYSVPFLLSDGSGHVSMLFTYMTIINLGILFLATRKNWKSLFFSSIGISWMIYISWFALRFDPKTDVSLVLVSMLIFYIVFQAVLLLRQLRKSGEEQGPWLILHLVQSVILFGVSLHLSVNAHFSELQLTFLFLLYFAIHTISFIVFWKKRQGITEIFFFIAALFFLNAAGVVYFDAYALSVFMSVQAVLLALSGNKLLRKNFVVLAGQVLIYTAAIVILYDWSVGFIDLFLDRTYVGPSPFFNESFLAVVVLVSAVFLQKRFESARTEIPHESDSGMYYFTPVLSAAIFLFGVLIELNRIHFPQMGYVTEGVFHPELSPARVAVSYSFVFVFLAAIFMLNYARWKVHTFGLTAFIASLIAVSIFLFSGLLTFSEAREIYLSPAYSGSGFLIYRYLTILALVVLARAWREQLRDTHFAGFRFFSEILLHVIVLWLLTSEMIQYLDLAGGNEYKLGISILWGVYAFVLMAFGIYRKAQLLRIFSFVLFGITLVKLFLYDIAQLNTISKTIVFVALGVLLLIISFLYNKFKHLLFEEDNPELKEKQDV